MLEKYIFPKEKKKRPPGIKQLTETIVMKYEVHWCHLEFHINYRQASVNSNAPETNLFFHIKIKQRILEKMYFIQKI